MTDQDYLRDLWRETAGKAPKVWDTDIETLKRTQWSPEFERMMRDRLVMGALRYGDLHAQDEHSTHLANEAGRRIALFHETGNREHLVDAANFCLCAFLRGEAEGLPLVCLDRH